MMTCKISQNTGECRIQLRLILFILLLIGLAAPQTLFAQPSPPNQLRITTIAGGNFLEWIDGGNNGATTLVRYEIGRSTNRGGGYAVVGNTTGLNFTDPLPADGNTYYYVVRDVSSAGNSAWSSEVIRFTPFNSPTADATVYKNETLVNTRWPLYENEIVKTFVGLSAVPGEADITGFIDVGHATAHSFPGLSLSEGTTYYVTVKVQDTTGFLQGYGTSTCSSAGFTLEKIRILTDENAAAFFNNSQARVMTRINGDSVETTSFTNNVLRRYRLPVTLKERNIESRFNAPVEIVVSGTGMPTTENAARNQIRVANEWGAEVPSNVLGVANQLITQDVYNAGVETVNFITGYSSGGGGAATKNPANLYLRATTDNTGVRTFVTETPIDLSIWDEIEINWQNTGDNNNGNRSFFVASPNQMGSFGDFAQRLVKQRRFDTTETLDVSGLSGNHYLRIHANDNGANSTVYVYRITLRRTENQTTLVLLANLPKNGSQDYWVYWGGGNAASANFITNSNDTSQRAWSRFYSRKLLPPGIESGQISEWTRVYPNVGYNTPPPNDQQYDYDRGGRMITLPWYFPYFANSYNQWFFSIKGHLISNQWYANWENTWNRFAGNNECQNMIAPLFLDLSIYAGSVQPQHTGYYTLRKNTGLPDERYGFFWRANRYGRETDIYMFQTFLYKFGDIAHRYEYLTYTGLFLGGDYDNPVNVAPHHTAGISRNNNSDYFWITPLRDGSALNPTSFFQYKNAVDYSLGTAEDAGAGFGFAGHIDSHIFDSCAASPNWDTMEYVVSADGGKFNFLIRSGPGPKPDSSWTTWTQIATNIQTSGSATIPAGNQHRFMQYRCVFLKADVGNNPTLDRVNFLCRGLEITSVSAAVNEVSQGQTGVVVTVNLKNFHDSAIQLDDLDLVFSLGSYTQTINPPGLPSIPGNSDLDLEFLVDVWDDSPTGDAVIHAAATGTSGLLQFVDLDADTPLEWTVRRKAELYIKEIDTTPTSVNKGQTVLVRMLIENRGEAELIFNSASLTFDLGSYEQTLIGPPPGTPIASGGSVIANFSVTVKSDCPSVVDTISGTATGTNSLSMKLSCDTDAEITDSWVIQNPAVLVLQKIDAPEIVYRGQSNVPLKLTASNEGEAELSWDRSFILPYFSLGTYDSVTEDTLFPLDISSGLSAEGNFLVNISPATATGTSSIDAKIEGTDKNTGFAVDDEYAVLPATWTIIQEFVKTYSDAAVLFPSNSFNRPEAGNVTIFSQAEQLAPFQEYSVRWFDPSGNQISFTNPPLTSTDEGKITSQLTLDATAEYGIYTVRITNPLNTHIACENKFSIVSIASLSAALQLPDKVTVGQPFIASMTFINSGGAGIDSAYPDSIEKFGPGDANLVAGPNPALHDIEGNGQATFTFDFSAVTAGEFSIRNRGYGYDANSGDFLTSLPVTSNICEVKSPPQLVVSDLSSDLIEVNLNQQNIRVLLSVFNQPASGFTPPDFYLYDTGTENVTFVAGYSEGTGNSQQAKQATQLYLRAEGNQTTTGWVTNNETAERTYVTDVPIDLTNVINVHIRWSNTGVNNANNQSFFIISPNKNGDHNDSTLSIARTRNFAAVNETIGVGGLSGNYYLRIHARDNDNGAQRNSVVNVARIWLEYETIPSDDQAGAYIEAASLTFDFGTHFQVIDSPALPFFLAPGETQIITFLVTVDADSDTGLVNISGSFLGRDENWAEKEYGITGGSHFWTIRGVRGLCSAKSTFNPEQYSFNIGQTVFARFENLPLNQNYRIRFYNNSPDGGTLVKSSPPLNSGAYGICDDLWSIEAADPNSIPRQWRVFIHDGTDATVGNILATQFFQVQNPGQIQVNLTLEPEHSFVGEPITAKLQVTNPGIHSSTIASVTPAALEKTPAADGDVTPLTPASPESVKLVGNTIATFTWTFISTQDTDSGSFSMTSTTDHSAFGYDINDLSLEESGKAVSNSIYFYRRAVEVASPSLQHAACVPGQTSPTLVFRIDNIGNYRLDSLKWILVDLKNADDDYLSKSRLSLQPAFVGHIDTADSALASHYINVPFNQPAGTYIATMSIFEDIDNNNSQDAKEPFDLFSIEIPVLSAKNIVLSESFIDLGNWAPGQTSIAVPVEFFNAGNLNLEWVKIRQTTGTASFQIADPQDHGAMAIAEHKQADMYAILPPATTAGIYIATWTVFEDENGNNSPDPGEPAAEFAVRTGVGAKSFTVAPINVNIGDATPTYVIEDIPLNLENIGALPLGNLKALTADLENGSGDKIASDNVVLFLPTTLNIAETRAATLNFYTPAGTGAGTFSGKQWIYEDDNHNNKWDLGEASASFNLSVDVVEYRAIQVINSTVDIGDLAAGTGGSTLFWCRNIGNVPLISLRWNKVDLHSPSDAIAASEYEFPPSEPFSVAPGSIFQKEVAINVPPTTTDGEFIGNVAWLYEDIELPAGSRQPTEPQDNFQLRLRVGNHSLDIIEATVTTSGPPATLSAPGSFNIKNTGSLTVSNPKATATALIGPTTLPAEASIFTPVPIGFLVAGQSRSITWRVQVPPTTPAGFYNGTVRVWNDSNNNGSIEAAEAFADAALQFEVTEARIIEVVPTTLDLLWATENSVTEGTIEVWNRGNVDLTDLHGLTAPLFNAVSDSIANIVFDPHPIGSLVVGDSKPVIVRVTAGAPLSTGVYSGIQRIYDDYQPANSAYSINEESDTFVLSISIGIKEVDVTDPVNFASSDPGQMALSPLFTASNLTVIPLTRLKWHKSTLTNGSEIIPAASLTFTPPAPPATYFGLGSSASNNSCQATLVIGAHTEPGNYTGKHTLWEDDNNNGIIDPGEASATFNTNITVNAKYALDIVPPTVDLGTVQAGQSSAQVDVAVTNLGNVSLNTFAWNFLDLHHIGGHTISAALIKETMPAVILPGQTVMIQLHLDAIPANQEPGIYQAAGHALLANGGSSDVCEIIVNVESAEADIFGPDTVYQQIAPGAFNDLAAGQANERYILSAMVNPGSGSANLGFYTLDLADAPRRVAGITVNSDGTLLPDENPPGIIVKSGVVLKIPHPNHPDFLPTEPVPNWYRVFIAFDFAFDSANEKNCFIVLRNDSAESGRAVWFDGIQLEKAVFEGQDTPTSFGIRPKIISPNLKKGLEGKMEIYRW